MDEEVGQVVSGGAGGIGRQGQVLAGVDDGVVRVVVDRGVVLVLAAHQPVQPRPEVLAERQLQLPQRDELLVRPEAVLVGDSGGTELRQCGLEVVQPGLRVGGQQVGGLTEGALRGQ